MAEKSKQQKLDELLGRALRDKEFRKKLTANPKSIALEEGLASDELDVIAGGMLTIGVSGKIAFCTAKTCNEKGGTTLAL
jgi:hypothetical protein